MNKIMKVYITRYVATLGIYEVEVERIPGWGDGFVKEVVHGGYAKYHTKGSWHTDRASALKKGAELLKKNIQRVEKRIVALKIRQQTIESELAKIPPVCAKNAHTEIPTTAVK